jgi:hypothetical protein
LKTNLELLGFLLRVKLLWIIDIGRVFENPTLKILIKILRTEVYGGLEGVEQAVKSLRVTRS